MKVQYRPYSFDPALPVFAFIGSQRPSSKLYDLNTKDEIRFIHLHNCMEIALPTQSTGFLYTNEKGQNVEAGDIAVIAPYCAHIMREESPAVFRDYLYIEPSFLWESLAPGMHSGSAVSDIDGIPTFSVLSGADAELIRHRCYDIIRELQGRNKNWQLCVKGLLLALIIELSRCMKAENSPAASRDTLAILPALRYIHSHFREAISADELQNLCHLSGTHFRRLFHDIMGSSPMAYIQNMRIAYACQLLLSTNATILEISMRSGYDSVSSFNRQFIKAMEITPSKWRSESVVAHSVYLPEASFDLTAYEPD